MYSRLRLSQPLASYTFWRRSTNVVTHKGDAIEMPEIRAIIRKFRENSINNNGQFIQQIDELLHHVAFGNPAAAKKILDEHPHLIMQKSHVIAPTGDLIFDVTPYECALCVGDHYRDKHAEFDMLPMLATHLTMFAGEEEQRRQNAIYQTHIDKIGTEDCYQFQWIFDIIKNSSPEEISDALTNNFNYESELRNALAEFRRDFPLRIITNGMLCNYANICELYKMYVNHVHELHELSENNSDMCALVWRQIVGWVIHRRLPGCERQAFARALFAEGEPHAIFDHPLERKLSLKYSHGEFQSCTHFHFTADEESPVGPGWDYTYDMAGGGNPDFLRMDIIFERLMVFKKMTLVEMMQPQPIQTSKCVIS